MFSYVCVCRRARRVKPARHTERERERDDGQRERQARRKREIEKYIATAQDARRRPHSMQLAHCAQLVFSTAAYLRAQRAHAPLSHTSLHKGTEFRLVRTKFRLPFFVGPRVVVFVAKRAVAVRASAMRKCSSAVCLSCSLACRSAVFWSPLHASHPKLCAHSIGDAARPAPKLPAQMRAALGGRGASGTEGSFGAVRCTIKGVFALHRPIIMRPQNAFMLGRVFGG